MVCLAGLYRLFGLHPLGYHLFNAGVLVSVVLLFYLTLREFGEGRLITLSTALVYGLLPHFSTDRFWMAAFQANVSMALCFLSYYSALRSFSADRQRVWRWRLACSLALIGSILAYEAALPLLFLIPLVAWAYRREAFASLLSRRGLESDTSVFAIGILIVLGSLFVFKLLTQTGTSFQFRFLHRLGKVFEHAFVQALAFNFGRYGFGFPRVLKQVVSDYSDPATLALGAAVGLVAFVYLQRVADQTEAGFPAQSKWLKLIVGGLIVYGCGYSIFFVNVESDLTTTGVANRIAIAVAVGTAMSIVGCLGWICSLMRFAKVRAASFCVLLALYCTSGFIAINTLASFWVAAYRQQQLILADIRNSYATLPSGATLILDGACPYVGPGVVFEGIGDLDGALQILYGDPTLRANIVTPKLGITEKGLSKSIYGLESFYPYGQNLLVYNFAQKIRYRLIDAGAARLYFRSFNPDRTSGCPTGQEGFGVPIF
jgi:hypothetical protein